MKPEPGVEAVARDLIAKGAGQRAPVFRGGWWDERLLRWAMRDPAFKTQLFRFVDVLPACRDAADVRRHVEEYFAGDSTPASLRMALGVGDALPAGVTSVVARRAVERLANQFILGTTAAETAARVGEMWRSGVAATVDLLGEKVVTDGEADRYAARVAELVDGLVVAARTWPAHPRLQRDDIGDLPRANVSIKPTAFTPFYAPLTGAQGIAEARRRLMPILEAAAAGPAFVWFDMEHYDVKDLTLELFREVMAEPALAELDAGVVLQAYLRDTPADLAALVEWARSRPRPVSVRLVKGAYWDAERVVAVAEGWPVPVWEAKDDTDACYEACVSTLHDAHGAVRAAFATHNLRSMAVAVDQARRRGIADDGYEIQMLHGMAEPLQHAVREAGHRLRLYAPMGELVPGMAYLVRRLLENTSNESFVRQRFAEGRELRALLAPPAPSSAPSPAPSGPAPNSSAPNSSARGYAPEPHAEWRRAAVREEMRDALAVLEMGRLVPAVIGGERAMTTTVIESRDPAHPDRVVATSASCTRADADEAVVAAREAWERWRRTPAVDRAGVLVRAAAWMRERRFAIAALEVAEAGKPWAEADADVCESIDFCEYYAQEMLRLDRGGVVQSPPGEHNTLRYQPKGVGVVIGPWNFPLAIPTGMTVAALVTGNAVVLKPAEQTPATAGVLVRALESAGLPPGVLALVPGVGEEVGAHLVAHRDVAFVVFTGSKAVGLEINRVASEVAPGQRHVKRVIAEMGGKNALVVDSDADLDQAVPAAVQSSFGFSGQKCSAASRIVVHRAVFDAFVERFVGATRTLRIGDPRSMSTQMGPVIDEESWGRIRSTVAAPHGGRVVLARDDVPEEGWYVGPTVVVGADPASPIAREEIFGPVVNVIVAETFADAVAMSNDTEYALTAGVFSRSPAHIAMAASELRAGNVYINRSTTGAVVGRQPFGGYGMSGVGSKAGGPDYLMQMLDPRVVTENTLRQGFVPEV